MLSWLLVALCYCADPNPGQIWPGFRAGGSSLTIAKDLPLRWSPNENVAWRILLPGYGQSSPVIWDQRIFVTSVAGENKESCLVTAVAVSSGEIVWQQGIQATHPGTNNPSVSRAAPTPVVDRDGVYAFFESGDLLSIDHSGKVRWQRSLAEEGPFKNHHGLGSSLAQTDSLVIALIEHGGPSRLIALDKATGAIAWETKRKSGLSWASPIVVEHQGKQFVLVSSNGSLTLYGAVTGEEVCALHDLVGNLIPSPSMSGDLVIVGAGESGLTFDRAAAARSNCAVRLSSRNGKQAFETIWQGQKAVLQHASPVEHQGLVYLVTKAGVLHCLDSVSGKERFVARLDSACWATPIVAEGRIYFFGRNGVTTVIASGPEFQRLATNQLWSEADFSSRRIASQEAAENRFPKLPEQGRAEMEAMLNEAIGDVVYGVAAVDRALLIRTGTELYCIRGN